MSNVYWPVSIVQLCEACRNQYLISSMMHCGSPIRQVLLLGWGPWLPIKYLKLKLKLVTNVDKMWKYSLFSHLQQYAVCFINAVHLQDYHYAGIFETAAAAGGWIIHGEAAAYIYICVQHIIVWMCICSTIIGEDERCSWWEKQLHIYICVQQQYFKHCMLCLQRHAAVQCATASIAILEMITDAHEILCIIS